MVLNTKKKIMSNLESLCVRYGLGTFQRLNFLTLSEIQPMQFTLEIFDGWDELLVESNYVLCIASSTMVNNWYSVLYSLANGLTPKLLAMKILLRGCYCKYSVRVIKFHSFTVTSKKVDIMQMLSVQFIFWTFAKEYDFLLIQTLAAPGNDSSLLLS